MVRKVLFMYEVARQSISECAMQSLWWPSYRCRELHVGATCSAARSRIRNSRLKYPRVLQVSAKDQTDSKTAAGDANPVYPKTEKFALKPWTLSVLKIEVILSNQSTIFMCESKCNLREVLFTTPPRKRVLKKGLLLNQHAITIGRLERTYLKLMHFKWEVTWTHGTQPNAFYG